MRIKITLVIAIILVTTLGCVRPIIVCETPGNEGQNAVLFEL